MLEFQVIKKMGASDKAGLLRRVTNVPIPFWRFKGGNLGGGAIVCPWLAHKNGVQGVCSLSMVSTDMRF